MTSRLNRSGFLKLMSVIPPAVALPAGLTSGSSAQTDAPNLLVLVFDTWSAPHLSLYGYPRQTTPYLDRLAQRAVVYHNHYAGGHFTIPGTASLLTGVHTWRHKLYHGNHELHDYYRTRNLFGVFPDYYRFAYTHNTLAEKVLGFLMEELDRLKPHEDLYYTPDPIAKIFRPDYDIASVSWIRSMETFRDGNANSVFFSRFWTQLQSRRQAEVYDRYPLGLPQFSGGHSFYLEDAIDWLADNHHRLPDPSLTYFHLLPPHHPYHTRADFYQRFAGDGLDTPNKPESFLSEDLSREELRDSRRAYDEFILLVDSEINRLFTLLQDSGSLENTWVVLTSDHGELFERGIMGHAKPALYEPLIKVPLLIFPPGQQERVDIHLPTSAVDVLPTLLAATGRTVPDWLEGRPLPPFASTYPADRPVHVIDAKFHHPRQPDLPLQGASLVLLRHPYKLIWHYGQDRDYTVLNGIPQVELFHLEDDPEELVNLAESLPELAAAMQAELRARLDELDLLAEGI